MCRGGKAAYGWSGGEAGEVEGGMGDGGGEVGNGEGAEAVGCEEDGKRPRLVLGGVGGGKCDCSMGEDVGEH